MEDPHRRAEARRLPALAWGRRGPPRSGQQSHRLLSGVARQAFKLRAELVERGFALTLDRGGMRRAWLHGREEVQKRYLIHVAGYNLGLIMRLLTGAGTPRELAARASAWVGAILTPDGGLTAVLLVTVEDQIAVLVVSIQADPFDWTPTSSTGC